MDEGSFDALYTEAAHDLARQVALIVGDLSVAEDAVASAWARTWALAETGGAPDSAFTPSQLRTRALGLTRAVRSLRSRPSRRSAASPLPAGSPVDGALVAALLALPEAQRSAYVRHHLAGVSSAEIAVEMESTAATARSRIAEAAAALGAAAGTSPDRDGAEELVRRLHRVAASLPVVLPPPDEVRTVRATTEHQRMLATTAAIGVGVLALLVWIIGVAVNRSEPPAYAADPATAVTPPPRTPTPTPTPTVSPTPLLTTLAPAVGPPRPGEAAALPRALLAPTPARAGRRHDVGYLQTAFSYAGEPYLVFDRAQPDSGINASTRLRTLAVHPRLTVLGGRWLGGRTSQADVAVPDFLAAVTRGRLAEVAVRLTYRHGRVRRVEPYASRADEESVGLGPALPRSTGRVAFPR